jgi:hypothetical protein
MSILSALRTQSNSIDDLAKLPQAMIMQMAQKGQIREDMLAPILARKAELAQASANMRAMQQQSAKPTVMEQILSQNAMAEAPESARDMGVAQLPVREDMYAPQSMAGGGIVAFQDNPNQPVSADMPATLSEEDRRYLEENPYLQRSRGLSTFGRQLGQAFTDPRNYNPISLYQRYVGDPFARAANKFVNETPEEQAQRFRTAQMARTGEIPMFAGKELTTKGKMVAEGRMNPNESVTDVIARERKFAKMTPAELDEIARGQGVFPEGSPALPGMPPVAVAKSGNVSTTKGESQAKKEPPKTAQDNKPPEEPLYSKYEKMLMDEREAAKGAREEAKYARMLEAGLGILGGTSQYAFENIGKGAAPALRGYGEDIRGLRAEERGRVKELLGIEGMRQEAKRAAEDQALKKEMIRIQEIAARKPSSVAELAALYRTDPELARLVQGEKKAGTLTFEDAYKLVAVDPKNLALTDAQKAQKARELMVLGAGGSPGSALPPGLPPGTVQVGTSQGKPVYKTPDGKLVTAS